MIIKTNPTLGSTVTVSAAVGGQIDSTPNKQQDHVAQALGRLIEYWKNKPNMRGLTADYQAEIAELENAVWQVILLRFPDNAGTAQLDVLGRIVGEERGGLSNADFLIRIKARIRANSSLGNPVDIFAVIKLITSAAFRYTRDGVASFRIDFLATPTDAVMRQLPSLVKDTRAAGVGASINFITDNVHGARYGYAASGTFNQHIGYGSFLDFTNAPHYGHGVQI
jgi:hypothetical protein